MTYPMDDQLTTEESQPRTTGSQDNLRAYSLSFGGSIPSQGSPPTAETVPDGVTFDRWTAPAGLASPLPAGEAPRRRPTTIWPQLVAVVSLAALIGVIVIIAMSRPVAGPVASSASTGQPAGSVSQPASTDPSAVAATARTQLNADYARVGQAAQQFEQVENAATQNSDEQAARTGITNFRAAVYEYDQGIRGIMFPTEQQAAVNTQLLPATDRLIADLDQAADPDPSTALQIKGRAIQDAGAIDSATQQVYDQLGN
ncbi:hypothetical protein LQ327_22650 [Actinomycetospora endophytica]|uniref:Uncharacterized protein n=1 Tax=Actinomycetospora endophytica TaxID=2291215 RepID=A0ABS8PE37_9PSEU|nr:hypothetical protein [Actinomycetospora endophytica]MCD2196177.1 hypothetical protein [Actinomycetospora endophytica]